MSLKTIYPTYFWSSTPKKDVIMQRKSNHSAKRQLELIMASRHEFISDPHGRKHQRLKTLSEVLWAQNHTKSRFISLSKGCFSCRWPVSCSWGSYQSLKTKFVPKGLGFFAEAISVRKTFAVILQCLLWFTEELLSLFSLVWFLAAFIWKAALVVLNTWSQQCSFLDCWLSLAHFLIFLHVS